MPLLLLSAAFLALMALMASADVSFGQTRPLSLNSFAIAAGDLDSDGDNDIVSAPQTDDRVLVYLNTGTALGNFSAPTVLPGTLTGASGVRFVGLADLDADGDLDVFYTAFYSNCARWHRNNGTGGFSGPLFIDTILSAWGMAFADLNGDGHLDVIAAGTSTGGQQTLSWYRGNGTGGLSGGLVLVSGILVWNPEAADMDSDGDVDVMATAADNGVLRFRNNGTGGFTQLASLSDGPTRSAYALAAKDLDLDGDVDLLVSHWQVNSLVLFRHTGIAFTFFAEAYVQTDMAAATGGISRLMVLDLSGDGLPDIAASNIYGNGGVFWYRNLGIGTMFTAAMEISSGGFNPVWFGLAADLDGDGNTDLAGASGSLAWWRSTRFCVANPPTFGMIVPPPGPPSPSAGGPQTLFPPATVNFTCNSPTSLLVGPRSISCRYNGSFTAAPPFCGLACSPVLRGTLDGGTVNCTNNETYGSVCTFTCAAGTGLVGAPTRTCGTFSWSGPGGQLCSMVSALLSTAVSPTNGTVGVVAMSGVTRSAAGNLVTSGADRWTISGLERESALGAGDWAAATMLGYLTAYQSFGAYQILPTITVAGSYRFRILINEQLVGNVTAHRYLFLFPGPPSGAACVASGEGLVRAEVGAESAVLVQARDSYGNNVSAAGSVCGASLKTVAGLLSLDVVRLSASGVFAVRYTPAVGGLLTLSVAFDGTSIEGSPWSFVVPAACGPGYLLADVTTGACGLCPSNTFKTNTSSAQACTACDRAGLAIPSMLAPPGSVTQRNCSCQPGFYTPAALRADPNATILCLSCPRGASCPGGRSAPSALPGWSGDHAADAFAPCPRTDSCLGDGRCAAGYAGYLCKDCAPEHYPSDNLCARCPPAPRGLLAGYLIALVACGCFALLVMLVTLKASEAEGSSTNALLRGRRFPSSVPLVVVVFQIVGILGAADLRWSTAAKSTLSVFRVAGLDAQLFASKCSLPGFEAQYMVSVLAPLLFFGTVFALLLWLRVLQQRVAALAALPRLGAVTAFTSLVFLAGPLAYIPLARSTLRLFDCVTLADGRKFLSADLTVQCLGPEWWRLFPLGIAALVVYVIGIPGLIAALLWRHRAGLFVDPKVISAYGSVYKLYRRPYFYAAIVIQARKLAIVIISLFSARVPTFLLAGLILVIGGSALLQNHAAPYYFPLYDALEVRLSALLCGVLLCGVVFYASALAPNEARQITTTVVLLLLLAALVICAAVYVVRDVMEIRAERSARRQGLPLETGFEAALSKAIAERLADCDDARGLLRRIGETAEGSADGGGGGGAAAARRGSAFDSNSLCSGEIEMKGY